LNSDLWNLKMEFEQKYHTKDVDDDADSQEDYERWCVKQSTIQRVHSIFYSFSFVNQYF
jgi:hypothetical protein